MGLIISLLVKFAPYLLVGLAMLLAIFKIRRQGVLAERGRWQAKQAQVQASLDSAVSKDTSVDTTVKEKIDAIKKDIQSIPPDGDKFRF